MATKKGVWGLQQVRDKQLASNWGYDAADPGSYFTWGNNNMGQLGQNTTDDISSPVQVPGSWTGVYSSSGGEGTSGGVKSDGTLWTWGFNGFGQGGRNDRVHRSSPVQIGTDTNWGVGGLRTGNYWSMATKTNGTLWTWGRNGEGWLGHNKLDNASSPTQVGTDTTWGTGQDKCAADNGNCLAIKTDGTLWSWGAQDTGALGQNNNTSRSSPMQVGTNTNWNTITCCVNSTLAIKTDGTLWAWGVNERGELGQNQGPGGPYANSRSSPVQVGTETTWTQIRACSSGAIWGIKTNGTLWSWGYNSFGFTGQNDTVLHSSPCQIGTDTNWQSVRGSSGALAKCTKTDGTLWLWGRNDFGGAIPGGEATDFSSPVQVPGTSFGPLVGGTQYGVAVVLA